MHRYPLMQALRHHFGFSHFRAGQQQIVEAVLSGRDVLAVLATGAGKSLCYQLPALLFPGITIVISPLISLMQDQVDHLKRKGIHSALFLNSSLSKAEQDERIRQIESGLAKIVYLAPERLRTPQFRSWVTQLNVSLLVVDEAHCVSEWGHDFRTDYLLIKFVREWMDGVPVLAVTATATPRVAEDIVEHVGLRDPFCYLSSFDRPNLYFSVERAESRQIKYKSAVEFLQQQTGSGVIYAASRNETEELTQFLQQLFPKRRVAYYHAGLSPAARSRVQHDFIEGQVDWIVATNAFGMGIDKPNIRFVLHLHIPSSVESYYQEVGRAGRDGHPAVCHLIYSEQDRGVHQYFVRKEFPDSGQINQFADFLSACAPGVHLLEKKSIFHQLRLSEEQFELLLHLFERYGVISRLDDYSGQFQLDYKGECPPEAVQGVQQTVSLLRQRRLNRYTDMVNLIKKSTCRRKSILDYFEREFISGSGEAYEGCLTADCCDWCTEQIFIQLQFDSSSQETASAVADRIETKPVQEVLPGSDDKKQKLDISLQLPQTESEEAFRLGEQRGPEGIPRLLELLQSRSVSVRRMACSALGKISCPQVAPHLLQSAGDSNPQVRQYALKALGKIEIHELIHFFPESKRRKYVQHLHALLQQETKDYNKREFNRLLDNWKGLL